MYANKRYHFLQSSLALSTEKVISILVKDAKTKDRQDSFFAYICPTSFPFQTLLIVKNSFSGLVSGCVEALATKPDDLSPIPWNHTMEGE